MKKITFTIFATLFCWAIASAGQQDDLFQQANEAYQNNEFKQAIDLYQQVIEMGYQSTELEYNLANAYFRKGETGKAILHYERALVLSPRAEDVLYNLSIALQKVDKREQLSNFFLTETWNDLRTLLPIKGWAGIALVLWWTGFAGFIVWLYGKTRDLRKTGFIAGSLLLIISILPFALFWNGTSLRKNTKEAIILVPQPSLKSAPDEAGAEILKLIEGEKVDLIDHLSGYWQVRLSNGEKGWVSDQAVEGI